MPLEQRRRNRVFSHPVPMRYAKSESYNPDSKQAARVGANGVCPAQPGLAKADLVLDGLNPRFQAQAGNFFDFSQGGGHFKVLGIVQPLGKVF